jgi:hypothetical protein
MFVIGGRTNMPEEATSLIEVYNTETSEWSQFDGISRYRHAVVAVDQTMYVHGGFEPEFASHPLETMVSLDLSMLGQQKPVIENEDPMEGSERVDRMLLSRGGNNLEASSRRELREIKD